MLCNGIEQRRVEDGDRRYDGLIARNEVAVPLLHLPANGRIGEVEVLDSLKLAYLKVECSVEELPDELGAVHTFVRPLKRQVVSEPFEAASRSTKTLDGLWCELSGGVTEPLDDEVTSATAAEPGVEGREADGRDGFKYVRSASPEEAHTHVTVGGVGRTLYGETLGGARRVKDDVAVMNSRWRRGSACEGKKREKNDAFHYSCLA